MRSELRVCVSCGYAHSTEAWYYKQAADGIRVYVCAAQLHTLLDMPRWKPLNTSADNTAPEA